MELAYTRHKLHQYHINTTTYTIIIQKSRVRLRTKSNDKMTSILAIPGCRPGTHPMIDEEEEELQIKQASLSRQSIALPVPASVVVVICEPRGLSNPITMGSKTIKA